MKINIKCILYAVFFVCAAGTASPAIVIQSSIDGGRWMKNTAAYPLKGQKIVLKVNNVPGGTIQWYQIFPDISKIYKNANHPWEKNPYQWAGFAKIIYHKEELNRFRGQWKMQPFETRNSEPGTRNIGNAVSGLKRYLPWFRSSGDKSAHSGYYHKDVGSFWFQAEVEKDGRISRTPGIEDSDERGLSPKVFRISIRDGKGFTGYLTSFFNVPGLFGSIPYQSSNYIGADCADVLMAAYRKWKGKKSRKDYNVAMLVGKFPKVDEFDLARGMPDKQVKWGKKIRAGDFIAVRYEGRRQYQHIGALFSDANKNGVLDGSDLVIHAGPSPLNHSYLREGGFDGHVMILRP